MTAITAEAIPNVCLLEQWPGMDGFQSFWIGEHFLVLVSLLLTRIVSRMQNGRVAYFCDEEDGVDCVVEYVDADENLHGAMERSASMGDKYSNVLQEDRNFD